MGEANDEENTPDEVDEAEKLCESMNYRNTAMVSFFFDDDQEMTSDDTAP